MILKSELLYKLKFGRVLSRTISLIFLMLILSLGIEAAAPFDFDPNIDGQTLNLIEDVRFVYDFNVTTNESAILFTSDAQDKGFTVFYMNNATGLVNFTPLNDDVADYTIIITASNESQQIDFISMAVIFSINNTNDAPNITSFFPVETNTSVRENTTLTFNYTAIDVDVGDILNTSWYLDGNLVSTNITFNYTPGFCDSGLHNITLVINDTSNVNDTQEWNVTVNNTNRLPILNLTLENVTWQEDTNLINNLTLNNIFSDLDNLECTDSLNKDNLTFTATGNSSINVSIDITSSNVSFIPPDNFF